MVDMFFLQQYPYFVVTIVGDLKGDREIFHSFISESNFVCKQRTVARFVSVASHNPPLKTT